MGLPAFTLSDSVAASDNLRRAAGPTGRDPCRYTMLIRRAMKAGLTWLAKLALDAKFAKRPFDEFIAELRSNLERMAEFHRAVLRCKTRRRWAVAKRLAIKRRKQAAKRASKRRAA